MALNCYVLVNVAGPGVSRAFMRGVEARARNDSPQPFERAHVRFNIAKTRAIVHGSFDSVSMRWIFAQGAVVDGDGILLQGALVCTHDEIQAYLRANAAEWEEAADDLGVHS